jgi:L-alanine-DL-glutamate epimerase-like enolase superfamily enzyme
LLGGTGGAMRVTRILGMGTPEEVAEEALQAASEGGIGAFKVKTGNDPGEDIARIAAVRKAVGSAATIYADSNHGWTAEQAIRALTAMLEYGLDLIEEPSPAQDLIGRQRIAQQVAVTVMADESAPTLADAARELSTGSARALSIKTTRTGFTESAKLVALAEALGARTLIGSQADGMIGTSAALAFGSAHPMLAREPGELDYYTVLTDELVLDRLQVRDGRLVPSSKPGIGVEIDEDKLRHYRTDGRRG